MCVSIDGSASLYAVHWQTSAMLYSTTFVLGHQWVIPFMSTQSTVSSFCLWRVMSWFPLLWPVDQQRLKWFAGLGRPARQLFLDCTRHSAPNVNCGWSCHITLVLQLTSYLSVQMTHGRRSPTHHKERHTSRLKSGLQLQRMTQRP